MNLDRRALSALSYGHRVAFFEVFCGQMKLTLGVRAQGLCAPQGIDALYPLGGRRWNLMLKEDQGRCTEIVDLVDPIILHTSPPCTKLCTLGLKESQAGFDAQGRADALGLVDYSVGLVQRRSARSAGGSFESPKAAVTWEARSVVQFFGRRSAPKPGRFFADPDLCQYNMTEPEDPDLYWRKSIVLSATYGEIMLVNNHCEKINGKPTHAHGRVRGWCRGVDGRWAPRAELSAEYPLELGLAWGRAVARACFRICKLTAEEWARCELERAKKDPDAQREVTVKLRAEHAEETFAIWEPGTLDAVSVAGNREALYATAPFPQMEEEEDPCFSVKLTEPQLLDPSFVKEAGKASWGLARGPAHTAGQSIWMQKLHAGDLSGLEVDPSRYLELRDEAVTGNPRAEPSYKQRCVDAVGLGEKPDDRYQHITARNDLDLLRWAVRRGSGCMWLPESPRTSVRGFQHQLITRGPPVRMGMHRLSKPDTEWVEQAIREDVLRGQLVKGASEWGFPAFPTKDSPEHKAVRRKRRMVVDYRALNRVTVRKVFLIPNSDYIKTCVAGSKYISVGDLKEGFNQVDNTPEAARKMAVLTASGCYLPRGLTFGPTNGPEDFQDLVFNIFGRRLYREWYLFLDDLSIATGRKAARREGPSGAADVWG